MNTEKIEKMSGHWLLAKLGKKVLRPGGVTLTQKMLSMLNITSNDDVVEFAPGLGFTAQMSINRRPKSYIGIDADKNSVNYLSKKFEKSNTVFKLGNAAQSLLPEQSADKVYGEAMLSMHANHRKAELIREAYRILKPQGYYAIHELTLKPDDLDENVKLYIQKELALAIKVNARPLTISEWTELLEKEGFKVLRTETAPMQLLEPQRIINDEGIWGSITIAKNILLHPAMRKRVLKMKSIFKKYEKNMGAVTIIARKE